MSPIVGIERWITSTPWRRKCIMSCWKESASPLLRPCLGSHCYLEISGLNIRQLGELFRSQIPQKFWVNDWNQHKNELAKHLENENIGNIKHWCFIALGLHRVGFKLGEWNLIQFFETIFKYNLQPIWTFWRSCISLPFQEHWVIESFPSVVKCRRKLSTTVILWDPFRNLDHPGSEFLFQALQKCPGSWKFHWGVGQGWLIYVVQNEFPTPSICL